VPEYMRIWWWAQAGIIAVALGLIVGVRADSTLERAAIVINVSDKVDVAPRPEKSAESGPQEQLKPIGTVNGTVRGHLSGPDPEYRVLGKKAALTEFPTHHKLGELIKKYARLHNIDPKLVWAVMRRESGFNPQAVSPKGAMGLMQLIPSTAALMGVSEPFNIEQNISGGVKYLKHCLVRFNHDVILALAAYNAGPDNVVKYNGCPPFAETQAYVARVLQDYSGAQVNFPVNLALEKPRKPAAASAARPDSGLAWKVAESKWKVAQPKFKVVGPSFTGKLATTSSRGQLARLQEVKGVN